MSYKQTILITGGTVSLGYHAALNLARQYPDYQVILSSRTDKEHAADKINQALGQKNVSFLPLDLSSTSNIRNYAKNYSSLGYPPIAILLLNAGLQFPDEMRKNAEGYELTFAINHLGHALLFHLLTPHLSPKCRVIVTSSGTHDPAQKTGVPDAKYTTASELAHPTPETAQNEGRQRYSTSKLCNVLFTYAISRRLKAQGSQITINAFDPGLMPGTGLAREYSPVLKFLWFRVLPRILPVMRFLLKTENIHTAVESGASLAWVASGRETEGKTGCFFEGRRERESSEASYEVGKQDDLWEWTVRTTCTDGEEYLNLKV
ncbi:hypothetical protein HYFRA_00000045 [Hymenoscyphus fraxineus]|uniref:Uncharacterized protein n=1 Tax=Hymenoscyphus fraxineus TaxID=746836 RepID=A0A9N9PVY1_9HELO|nr:hypothetical protein HYFRA_00000045 [Hymenoscyphus fraxineus]